MADDKKGATIIQAGAKGGVSAAMPYVAIGVIGYLGLKHLEDMDIDVGGAAGQIIESFTEGADNVIERVKETAGDTYIYITETIEDTKDDIVEVADVRVEPLGKTVIGGEPQTFGEFLKTTRKGEGILPFYTGFLATVGHYGTGGLLTEPFIEAGRKTREILPESIREAMDVRIYGATPKTSTKSSGSGTGRATLGPVKPLSSAPKESQKVVEDYQSYVSAGGTRAPYAHKPDMAAKPTKDWKVVK